jgi:phage/plasmid-like protein (TIGR03299 family)
MHEIDMSNDRENMAYIGQRPWHNLGNELSENAPIDVWCRESGLDWDVLEKPIYTVHLGSVEQGYAECKGYKALMRSDTLDTLSIVTNRYNVVQPSQVVMFYERLTRDHGFSLETMGSLKGGKKIWGLAKTKDSFTIMGQDTVDNYILLATSYDGTLATRVIPTSVRVVCANTLEYAYNDKTSGLTISHKSMFDEDIVFDKLFNKENWERFEENANILARRVVEDEEAVRYFMDVLYPNKTYKEVTKSTRSANIINKVVNIYKDGSGQQTRSAAGTAWGMVNAITRYTDHETNARSESNMLHSAWFGPGRNIKNTANEIALERYAA